MNVLITGGAEGIGSAISKAFLEKGYNVVINYNKSADKARALAEAYPNALIIKADVSKEAEVKAMFREAAEKLGGIDILVNNAGISVTGLFQDADEKTFDEIMGVNFKSVFLCCKEAAPYMLKKRSGAIINISSIWGVRGASCEALYSASKAAVIGFTEAVAKELAPNGIRVNCVAPGIIDTKMNARLTEADKQELIEETPVGRIGTGEDIAAAVLFLADEKASFITGQTIIADGGFLG